jgi:hypothetical protein
MLYIDVGNTLRGGLRTGIQRVVRSLSYELAVNAPKDTADRFRRGCDALFRACQS